MQNIIIDEEFKALLPPLDRETFDLLEENLLQNGCRDALVIWNGILIDGHNRYEICTKHDIPFHTIDKEFTSRENALIWIITTQVSRRNLSPIQLSYYRGVHYHTDKKIQGTNNQYAQKSEKGHDDTFHFSTASRLAEHYKVSPKTINRDAKVASAIDTIGETSSEAKRKILSGEMTVDRKYLQGLSSQSREEIESLAITMEKGSFTKKKPDSPNLLEANGDSGTDGTDGAEAVDSKKLADTDTAAGDIIDGFQYQRRILKKKGDMKEWKTALRAFIDLLEDFYTQIDR